MSFTANIVYSCSTSVRLPKVPSYVCKCLFIIKLTYKYIPTNCPLWSFIKSFPFFKRYNHAIKWNVWISFKTKQTKKKTAFSIEHEWRWDTEIYISFIYHLFYWKWWWWSVYLFISVFFISLSLSQLCFWSFLYLWILSGFFFTSK